MVSQRNIGLYYHWKKFLIQKGIYSAFHFWISSATQVILLAHWQHTSEKYGYEVYENDTRLIMQTIISFRVRSVSVTESAMSEVTAALSWNE